ncbi:MAG: 1-acyl-sn-glycerol-3-phosphate acyltransferase [Limnospira sp. PMC 737.11]|uniref:1-acyl-sn-glycerol-3-phosphate acyltransferase n=1 Tax=unclassified Limnospira TaxID=2642885 RepID=UPI0028E149CA|nr:MULTISPECIES: 1-acyl-sn-glycerol-3-phosphate acyltransferase [unclassified Limnospira]MDT9233680.1 1-acyl-sn-glycerol-3-phosphate acyltransferase [Limnospira sp. PMC 917.15]MDT9274505.1 1-acyl-sn-glycerol-3-phosphate acyltransferase [Limnospira sp. PMC 737.11]
MPKTKTYAQPPLEFLPPKFNPLVLRLCQILMPLWMAGKTPIADIQIEQGDRIIELFQQFQASKIRFLLAFRHPNPNDPIALSQVFWRRIPALAKSQGVNLQDPVHFHFIYDRGIPLWAGNFVTWLFPQLGGSSILRGTIDRPGLKSARHLFVNGRFPIAAAPEGATNSHNQLISPLEPGIAQMAFWCVEDLHKLQRTETVLIVPLGVQYSYVQDNWKALESLLTEMETDCGLSTSNHQPVFEHLYPRLINLGNYLLNLMENLYGKFYHQNIPQSSDNQDLSQRLHSLLDIALKVSESYFGIQPIGDLTSRCRRLEQAGWEYIYRENLKSPEDLSAVDLGLANRLAEEASLRMWHMRLVESFVAVTGEYIKQNPSFDRFADTVIIIWTAIARLKGVNPNKTPNLGKQLVKTRVGEPIAVSPRWASYQSSRRQAIADLTQDLQIALEELIV